MKGITWLLELHFIYFYSEIHLLIILTSFKLDFFLAMSYFLTHM